MSRDVRALFVKSQGSDIPDCLTQDQAISITACPTGVEALLAFEDGRHDVVILDSGADLQAQLQFFYSLRAIGGAWPTPVAVLIDVDRRNLILPALEAGIDECISRSLDPEEMVARVHALARRSKLVAHGRRMQFADLALDPVSLKAWRGGRLLPLSLLQLRLLTFLMAHPGRVFTRGELLDGVWRDGNADERTVNQCVVRLRRALTMAGEVDLIRSARGIGYALDDDAVLLGGGYAATETILSHQPNSRVTTQS